MDAQSEEILKRWDHFTAELLEMISYNYVPGEKLSILLDIDEDFKLKADIIQQSQVVRMDDQEVN